MDMLRKVGAWGARFLIYVVLIVTTGAVLGALLFVPGAWLFGVDGSVGEIMRNGAYNGGFYALIWAPGLALVRCIMVAYQRRRGASVGPG